MKCLLCGKKIEGMVCSNLNNETYHPECFDKTDSGKKMIAELTEYKFKNKYMPLIKPEPKPDDNEQDFYHTIIRSPQWEAWENEYKRRVIKNCEDDLWNTDKQLKVFDIDESRDLGLISQEHFQEFIKFIKTI